MEKRRHRFSHGDRGEQGFRFRHDQARTLMEACGEEEGNFRLHLHIPPEHEGRADRAIEGKAMGGMLLVLRLMLFGKRSIR